MMPFPGITHVPAIAKAKGERKLSFSFCFLFAPKQRKTVSGSSHFKIQVQDGR